MSDKFTHPHLRRFPAVKPIFPATPQSLDCFSFLPRGFSPPPPPPPPLPPKSFQLISTDPDGLLLPFGCSGGGGGSSAAAAGSGGSFLRRNKVMESDEWGGGYGNDVVGGSNNNSRWPRQETLTLLEIRSRLDSKFKDSNHKGPLWDQVSRYIYLFLFAN